MNTATPTTRTLALTALAMRAFAGHSLLCRQALRHTAIDPASFTAARLVSGYRATAQSPDFPPRFSSRRMSPMTMPRSTALHMS